MRFAARPERRSRPSACGKTSLVQSLLRRDRALNFVALSAASIYSKYLGDSEARLRQAFRDARQRRPCLIFIDDIDGISARRDVADCGDSGVQNRVLSTLLNELDGVSSRDGVYVVAATNRIDRIDGALLRPGRFDVHLRIGPPSYPDRLAILRSYVDAMAADDDVALEAIAAVEMTGADIREICQRAGFAALAADRDAPSIAARHFDRACRDWVRSRSGDTSPCTDDDAVV